MKIKLLTFLGLFIFFMGLLWTGPTVDFLTILLTGRNLDNTYGLYAIISYVWVAPIVFIGVYIGSEIIIPKRKWLLISIYLVLIVIFELYLFLDTMNSFVFSIPENPGEDIIDSAFIRLYPTFILIAIFLLTNLFLNGFGFLYKGIHSTGIIRKKYFLVSLGFTLFTIFGVFEALLSPGMLLFLVRIGMISSTWFWYLGLREEPEKHQKIVKKEVEIAESLFRLSKRPDHITEEEVIFHKERKICLVCKAKISRVMYTCPECDALYCLKCSDALSNLENACWVCNTPLDESKPVKQYKKKEEDQEIEITENHPKIPKAKENAKNN